MKMILSLLLSFAISEGSFGSRLPGISTDTKISYTPQISQLFCSEKHTDPQSSCEAWLEKMISSLEGAMILKTECSPKIAEDLSLGQCISIRKIGGIIYFLK